MLSQAEIKQVLYNSLKELGLTEHEINLYVLSLSVGPVPIAKLAEQLGITRPNVYKVIEGLEEHELAHFSERKGYAKTFMVESPTVVTELVRKKREHLGQIDRNVTQAMPDLLALYRQGELPSSIRVIEDKEQFITLFDQIVDEAQGESQFCGSAHDFIGFISWAKEREWIARRIKKNVKIKALLLPSGDAETLKSTDSKELRETRILQGIVPFVTSFQLFANKVIIWQPKAPLAIVVADEYIVQMLKSLFNVLWETSKV